MLDGASYILMGSTMSTWNQIAKEGQQRERLRIESFSERSAASILSPRRSWDPAVGKSLLNQVYSKKRRKYIVCEVLGLL